MRFSRVIRQQQYETGYQPGSWTPTGAEKRPGAGQDPHRWISSENNLNSSSWR